ncbi:hypothetical protein NQ317_007756 [Molorchus minor]|uniref:SWIM-type domain-containing protein n=1 Tax=Molorchus minor TaxID=1323400 RepID=A0ABQ9JD77_9CUCU|nr:hypothetical protein NQ317_007756 [Molorchus minor]
MNDGQLETLKKYGNDCLCIDSTHGLNAYGFQLTTLMVLDDLRQGFPIMFVFSNRSDTYVMKVIFNTIKNVLGEEKLSPRVFLTDMDDTFYNAWCEVMGKVPLRLFCAWHVIRAWKKNLSAKIKTMEKQHSTYKILRTLLEESDKNAFEKMLPTCLNDLDTDPDLHDFVSYFKEHYIKNRKSWAYCYRQHAGINTNMSLERMHGTLKYIYLKGQKVRRLDKAISAMMRMVRDKLFERIITLNKGKLTKKISELRKRHANIDTMLNSVILEVEQGKAWTISSSKGDDIYTIEILNKLCKCDLKCLECNACIHSYICSCPDSAVRWNMCKHVHFLCIYLQKQNLLTTIETSENDNSLIIDEEYENFRNEEKSILKQLCRSETETTSDVNQYKEKIVPYVPEYFG